MDQRLRGVLFAFVAFSCTGTLFADAMLDFAVNAPTSGSISYAGGNAPLVGTNIEVDNVVGLATPLNNNVLRNCLGCQLNFTTGNFVSNSSTAWYFSGGGTITLTGTVDLNGNGVQDAADATGTLFSGQFTDQQQAVFVMGVNTFKIAGAAFNNLQNVTLTNYYGLPSDPFSYAGNYNISFAAPGIPPTGFSSSQIFSGDIVNAVPEPLSIVLFGTAMLGCVVVTRRKRRQQN